MNKARLNKLALQTQNGDEDAFCEIYQITKKGVFSFVYSVVGDYSVAEEIMQDTFIKVKQNINSFNGGNFSAWLIQIAKNMAFNHIKKAKRETPLEDADKKGGYTINESGGVAVEALQKALGEEERQIVVLHAVGGYKHREIAEILNKPLGTVTWTYKNAMRKLKNYIEGEN